MQHHNGENTIFLTALKKTLQEVMEDYEKPKPQPPQYKYYPFIGEEEVSDVYNPETIRKIYNLDESYAPVTIVPSKRNDIIENNNYNISSDEVPQYSQEKFDKYMKFFLDYENKKNEANDIDFLKIYPFSQLIDHLKFELFVWVASELLFKKPEEYSKELFSRYYEFEEKNLDILAIQIIRLCLSHQKYGKTIQKMYTAYR